MKLVRKSRNLQMVNAGISIRNVPIGKTGLPFQNLRLFREFSGGMNQKNVYHLHPNRNFWEFVVNGKQPQCYGDLPIKIPPLVALRQAPEHITIAAYRKNIFLKLKF